MTESGFGAGSGIPSLETALFFGCGRSLCFSVYYKLYVQNWNHIMQKEHGMNK